MSRDFPRADALRTELEGHGIKLHDTSKTWVASDGRKGNTTGPDFMSVHNAPPHASGGGGGGGYSYPAPSGPPLSAGGLTDQALIARIADRERARQARDYQRSDEMRQELRNLGVNIDDKTHTWTASDGRSGTIAHGVPSLTPRGAQPPPHQQPGYDAYYYQQQQHAAAWAAYYAQQQPPHAPPHAPHAPPSGGYPGYPGYPGY